jgi:hypothetical protein
MLKFSNKKIVVSRQKFQIILIIQHYYAKPKKVLRYVTLI